MRKITLLLALVASLTATQVYADYTAKNAAAATITFKNSGDCTAVVCVVQQQPVDSTGAAFGVTANPFFMTIGSGKVVSGAYASGALASGSIASGAMVDLGSQADSVCGTATGTCSLIALQKYNNSVSPVLGAGTARVGYTSDDPCTQKAKTNLAISQNGTSSVQLIALSGSTVIYVCSLSLIAAGATTVAITTGTGSACVTGNAAVIGTTTASIANSLSLAANGGLTLGNGAGTVAQGAASSELCMVLGTNVFVSGNLTYVQQ